MTTEVKPIPEGFHTITPSLIVSDAAKAIEFYKQALGAEVLGVHTTPDGSKVAHSELKIGNSIIFVNDEFPEMGACAPTAAAAPSITFNLYVEDADASFAQAVDAGATSVMPVSEMFWGDRWGIATDPYGYKWAFCTHVKDVTPEELERASKEMFSKFADKDKAEATEA
jgi:PhnB protein